MPRELPLGNGSLQINFDGAYRIIDLYYPYVGQDNHSMGHPCRVGLWVDGQFAWTDSDEWMRELAYMPDTLVTQVSLTHPRLQVALEFHDAIDFDRHIFVRRLSIANRAPEKREVRLFHYKGKVWVLSNALRGDQVGFDCAAVYGGLMAAANFAGAFGEVELAERYRQVAGEIRAGMETQLFSHTHGRFLRMVVHDPQGVRREDPTLDASLAGLFAFGVFDATDPRVVATMEAVRARLQVQTEVGGLARYENDAYQQVSQETTRVPGNPWIICTLWLAEWEIARATSEADLGRALELLQWVVVHASPSGCLPEQVHPYTGAPLSVCPLTWSHAAFVMAVLRYLDKLRELKVCPMCGNPALPRQASGPPLQIP